MQAPNGVHLPADSPDELQGADHQVLVELNPTAIRALRLDNRHKALSLREFPITSSGAQQIAKIIISDEYLQFCENAKMRFLINDMFCTLIPEAFSQKPQLEDVTAFARTARPKQEIRSQRFAQRPIMASYRVPSEWSKEVVECSFAHWLDQLSSNPGQTTHVLTEGPIVAIIVKEGAEIMLCNAFSVETDQDALYFISSALDSIGVQLGRARIMLYGNVYQNSGFRALLKKYVAHVEFGHRARSTRSAYAISQEEQQRFPTIFAAACV